MTGMDVAVKIITRGVQLDEKERYTEALICYQEGLQILVNMIKGLFVIFYLPNLHNLQQTKPTHQPVRKVMGMGQHNE